MDRPLTVFRFRLQWLSRCSSHRPFRVAETGLTVDDLPSLGTMAPRSSVRPDDRERDGSFRSHRERSVDLETVRTVLRNHPVRLAVLFGSQATGSADGRSDVDLAIELETHEGKRTDLYMRVLTDLSIALDRVRPRRYRSRARRGSETARRTRDVHPRKTTRRIGRSNACPPRAVRTSGRTA